jgi:hypothetical protein
MTQALYAHMNDKTIKKKSSESKKKKVFQSKKKNFFFGLGTGGSFL